MLIEISYRHTKVTGTGRDLPKTGKTLIRDVDDFAERTERKFDAIFPHSHLTIVNIYDRGQCSVRLGDVELMVINRVRTGPKNVFMIRLIQKRNTNAITWNKLDGTDLSEVQNF